MAVSPAPDGHPEVTDSTASSSDPTAAPARGRRVLVATCAVISVLCLVLLTYFVASTPAEDGSLGTRIDALMSDDDGAAEQLAEDREAAMAQAKQFALRLLTYGPQYLDESNQMPEYRELVKELGTAKFAADFEEGVQFAEQAVAQAGAARTAEVYATGVSSIDPDSATVLVAGSFTDSYPDPKNPEKRIDADSLPFRYEVTLVEEDGEWHVDKFVQVTDVEQEQQQ